MNEMTKQAIATFPKALNYGQWFSDQISLKALNAAAVKPEVQNLLHAARGHAGRGGATRNCQNKCNQGVELQNKHLLQKY